MNSFVKSVSIALQGIYNYIAYGKGGQNKQHFDIRTFYWFTIQHFSYPKMKTNILEISYFHSLDTFKLGKYNS